MAEASPGGKEAARRRPSRVERGAVRYATPCTPPAPRRGTLPSSAVTSRQRLQPPSALLPPATPSSPPPSASRAPSTGRPASASPRQEAGSARYLHRLLRIVKCTRAKPPGPDMADFLAGFSLGAAHPGQATTSACDSTDDLQLRLRETLAEKTTPTRAQHVATTLDIGATAQLTLSLSRAENDALESLTNVDPSLGGIRSASVVAENPEGLTLRVTQVADALMDQPQDDPVLQRVLAKHIISAVSATDGSAWVASETSRGSQGWDFTYLCEASSQQWDRQNKGRSKHVIGEFRNKEPDPKLMNRPAFDCRGRIRISFARGSRSISVKYDHTPLHRTVAEVAELFKRPPRQLPVLLGMKTPRKQGLGKNKRDSIKAQDENGNPRKRKKKDDGADQPQVVVGDNGPQLLPELTQNGQETHEFADRGVVDDSIADSIRSGQGPAHPSATRTFPIQVSPEEAVRRRESATKLLSDAGVEPGSLSAEQFNIFANQSPELQNESLNMLVKYGAERLRVVHPSNRDSSASASPGASTTPVPTSQAAPTEPTVTEELALQSLISSDVGSKSRTPGKSRKACFQCKGRRVKCPRQRPTCSECQAAGLGCEYPPQEPRRRKKIKSQAMVPADCDDDEAQPEDDVEEEHPQGEQLVEEQTDGYNNDTGYSSYPQGEQMAEEQTGGHNHDTGYSSYPQVPVADTLRPNPSRHGYGTHQPETPYFHSASGLALPQPAEPPVSQQMHATGSGLMLLQGTVHYPPHVAPTADAGAIHQSDDDPPVHLLASPRQYGRHRMTDSRRSLPTGPPQAPGPDGSSVSHAAASGWPSGIDNGTQVASKSGASHSMQQGGAGNHRSRGSRHGPPTGSPKTQDAVAVSQAALELQRQATSLPVAARAAAHPASNFQLQPRHGQQGQTSALRRAQPAASASQPPSGQAQAQPMDNSGRHRAPPAGASEASTYNSYARHGDVEPNTSANKIGYEPYSYQRSTLDEPAYPSYDGRRTAASTMSSENQGVTALAPAFASDNTTSSLLSPARGSAAKNRTRSPYGGPATARPTHASASSARTGHSSVNQQQNQKQQQRQQQQQQQAQATASHQPQGWYGFNNNAGGSHPYAPGNQGPEYSWNMHGQSWPGGVS